MDKLRLRYEDAQKKEEEARVEREKLEAEIIAKDFYKQGWEDRACYEDEKRATEAAKYLVEHRIKRHSK